MNPHSSPRLPAIGPLVLAGGVLALSGWAAPIAPVIPDAARPLPLSAVRLTGGPLRRAQDLNARFLLALEPDRMLAGYRLRAGLEPKAKGYGGWDSPTGKQLTGHLAGHYLSAVSLMWAATGDARFKARADYLVNEFKEVQDQRGTGYLGAITDNRGMDGAAIFEQVANGDIRSSGFDLNGMWSPWYTLHKTFAGLRDAYRFTGNPTALEVLIRFAAWAERVVSPMSDAQVQRMLNTEFGGMNEIFADLYADTGDPRWLALSYRFEHRAFTEPLKRHQDRLAGQHGNTQVPKMIGSLARFAYTGDPGDGWAASFFWDRVVQHHSYATGGHGKDEYFGEPDKLNDRVDGRTAETCNVYNMLKLTRRLFALRPDAHYADFHERALFNHILASQDPQDGWVCYMVPVGRGVTREYERNLTNGTFTCCTASSLESHALHGDGIYHESGPSGARSRRPAPGADPEAKPRAAQKPLRDEADTLWVNLYVPSTADWAAAGVRLAMETDFPEGESATLHLTVASPKKFTLALHRPFWAATNFSIRINGEPVASEQLVPPRADPGRRSPPASAPMTSWFVELKRTWKTGDRVTVALPKTLRLEPLPDNPRRVALLWGPLVLAGDLGEKTPRRGPGTRGNPLADVPVFVSAERPVTDWLKPLPNRPNCFRTDGVGRNRDVDFVPFYRLHRRTYGIYWDLFTPVEWEQRAAEIAAERERQRRLEAATVGFVQPGEMQAERDANVQGENTQPVRVMGRPGRRGSKWFSFDLPVDAAHPMALVVTYNHDEWQDRTFDILVDDTRIGRQTIPRRGPTQFFEVEYAVPARLVQGKQKVTVKFQATQGNEIAAVFGLRMIHADALRRSRPPRRSAAHLFAPLPHSVAPPPTPTQEDIFKESRHSFPAWLTALAKTPITPAMSNTRSFSRREFLRQTRTAALGVGAGLALPNLFLNKTRAATGENPSELVRIGAIGCGGQGNSNIGAVMKHVVALCDVDKKHLAATQARVEKANGTKVATFTDYRRLLERKDIDAVLVSTPDHWHALASADAMVAGKDVYCEKPLTLTIHEGQVLVKLARKYQRVFQTGSQQRSDQKFLKACEYIRNGRIGRIKRVFVGLPGVNYVETLQRGNKPLTVPDSEPPPELDYDMWLGPAPYRPYNVNRVHYLFRFFWDYSGGQMTNWGAHHLDIAQWALGMDDSGPIEIEGTAEWNKEKLYETPQTFHVTYRYANGTVVECNSGGGKYKMGATFEGEKGTIYVNRGALTFDPESLEEEPLKDTDLRLYPELKDLAKGRSPHHQNWLNCIKTRQKPICDVAVGHRSATVCHLGSISIRTGKKLTWDPAREEIVGDAEAAKWVSKPYRPPWKLPEV